MSALIEKKQYDPLSSLLDATVFEHTWRIATAYSKSKLVPNHFQGKPEDCFIAIQMALRCGVDPFAMLQSLYIVHGKPGMESKLMVALLNGSGRIKGAIRYEFSGTGKDRGCTAIVTDAESGKEVRGMAVTMAIADAEGWTKKDGSKWKTMPDLMLQYRSAAFLIRTTYPDVIMGIQSREELDDMPAADIQSSEIVDLPEVTKEKPSMPMLDAPKSKPKQLIADEPPEHELKTDEELAGVGN
jgi:hypothetical protein